MQSEAMKPEEIEALAREMAKGVKTQADLEAVTGTLTKTLIETVLKAELTDHLGYEAGDPVPPATDLELPFGSITEGNSSDQTITVANGGTADLVVGQIILTNAPPASFSIVSDPCSTVTLMPATDCSLTVRFSPVSSGIFSDWLDIPSNDPDESTISVRLDGTGTAMPVPDIMISDPVIPATDLLLPFGNVTEGTSSEQMVTITNDGNADLLIGLLARQDLLSAPFSMRSDNCSGQTVIPTGSCTVVVRFSPAGLGNFVDSFDIPSNDPDKSAVSLNVSGSGIAANTGGGGGGGGGGTLDPVMILFLLMLSLACVISRTSCSHYIRLIGCPSVPL